ncbi:MAG: molybdopterin dinucleotide binding domain-containing protein, partial [Alphaproteobacteria bacterium]
ASQYEKWEYTLFSFSFPENDIQLRAPLFDPLPGTLPEPEIYTRLAREMGLLPDDQTLADLRITAANDRESFAGAFRALLKENRGHAALAPEILYLTLGATLPDGAAGAAVLWPGCHRVAKEHPDAVRRALASGAEGAALGDILFDRIVSSRSGTVFAHHDTDDVWTMIRHQDGRIHLVVREMLDWIGRLDPAAERPDPAFPLILMAGQRRSYNANQIMRMPGWRKSDIDGSLRIHPDDLAAIDAVDGDWVSVETRTGRLTVRAEANDRMRPGMIALPHGYGMKIKDATGAPVIAGPRINRLTASDECDPIAATPYHKTIPAAVARATNEEISQSEAASERVQALVPAAGA